MADINALAEYDPEFGMDEEMFKDSALSRNIVREYHDAFALEGSGRMLSVIMLLFRKRGCCGRFRSGAR